MQKRGRPELKSDNETPQNFSVKLKRNTVTQDELNQIANVLNVKYEQYFVLANGDQVR